MLTEQPDRATPAEDTDALLIERSRRDPGCFAVIFDRHAEEILRYAHARLGPDLAEDVTAETFLAAFRHRDRYDTNRPDARPWLYGIAVRQIGRHRRALARRLTLLRAAPADLVVVLEPVPAPLRVPLRRLRRVEHEPARFARSFVHRRACREIVRVLLAAVQHDDERDRLPTIPARNV